MGNKYEIIKCPILNTNSRSPKEILIKMEPNMNPIEIICSKYSMGEGCGDSDNENGGKCIYAEGWKSLKK